MPAASSIATPASALHWCTKKKGNQGWNIWIRSMRIRYTWAGQPTEVNPRMNTIRARNFFVIRVSAGLLIAILLAATIPSLLAEKTPKSSQQIEQVVQDAV